MNSTSRVKEYRKRAAKLGRRRKEFLVTNAEHTKLQDYLARLRDK